MLAIKIGSEINGGGTERDWRDHDQLVREYQLALDNIEQIAARQIAAIKDASAAALKTMVQRFAIRETEPFSSNAEAQNTELIAAIAAKTVALAVDSLMARAIPATAPGAYFKKAIKTYALQWEILKLAGIDPQALQGQRETSQRNCLIGAVINFKLKARAALRREYAARHRALQLRAGAVEADSQIA